ALNVALAVELSGNGRLLTLCCPITPNVDVSYSVNPAMNRDPSGAMERTVDCPVTVRLRRIEADAVSYTNSTVDALLLMVLRPTMKAPSGVRVSLPRNVVVGRA